MESLISKIKFAVDFIRTKTDRVPEIGMILGSGLGSLADEITDPHKIPYQDIPHFPVSTVELICSNACVI